MIILGLNNSLKQRGGITIHIVEELDGGLTKIEIRALEKLAVEMGGQAAHIWNGRQLADKEIKENKYPMIIG